ncbi:MAG: M48 family metalloprotease [Planctomycetaceae bacterium]
MADIHMLDQWRVRARKANRAAGIVKTRIFLAFAVTPLIMLFSLWQMWRADIPKVWEYLRAQDKFVVIVGIAETVIGIGVLALAIRRLRQELRHLSHLFDHGKDGHIQQMSGAQLQEIVSAFTTFANAIDLPLPPVDVWINIKAYHPAPSIVALPGKVQLLVPLGFLKVLRSNNNAAKAIVAHEFGHLAQEDSRLWRLSTAYSVAAMRVLFPMSSVLALISVCMTPLVYNGWSSIPWITQVGLHVAQSLLPPIALLAFFYSIRQLRQRSEKLADMLSVALVGKQPLSDALRICGPEGSKKSLFSIHPSVAARIKSIENL